MSKPQHFSHSQLDMVTRCGQQWYYRYVEGMRLPPSVKMVVGRAVDHSVNEDLRQKQEEGELLTEEAVQDLARDGLEKEWNKSGVELDDEEREAGIKKTKGSAVDRSVTLAKHHHVEIAPEVEPVHIQRRFDITLEGYDAKLVGYIDIDEPEAVRDTKTTGKSPNQDAMAESTQLTAYALAKLVLDGEVPKQVKLDYLIDRSKNKKDRTPKHKTLVGTRSEADFQPLLNRVERALQYIETGLFMPAPPGSWWCSPKWCGYWNQCPWVNRASYSLAKAANGR